MSRTPDPTGISKAAAIFITINIVLAAAGVAGIFFMNSLIAGAADPNVLNACNWYLKMLFGLTSLTFDLAALTCFFSTRKDAGPDEDDSEAGLIRWIMRHRQA